MNYTFSGFSLLLFIIFVSCDRDKSKSLFTDVTDSCAIALKAEGPMAAQSMVSNNFSGALTNYWGDDTSKIDFTHVFENGLIMESTFYYENGMVQEEYHYKCGALHGEQKFYYENGQLARIIPFSYGYKQGRGEFYNEAGKLLESVVFERDSIVKKSNM